MRKRQKTDQDQIEQAIDDVLLGRKTVTYFCHTVKLNYQKVGDTCLKAQALLANEQIDDYIDKMQRKLAPAITKQSKQLLERELQDIQSGTLTLSNAVTFHRVAQYNKKPIENVYNSVFESVCERLQAEEEQSVSAQIDAFLKRFPPIFSQLERKGVIDKVRLVLDEAKSRLFCRDGRNSNERPWCCIEPHGTTGMSLFPSAIIVGDGDGDAQVGESVELETGERGVLICSHTMGLTPLDLFNDIVTDDNDMKNFLGATLSHENDRPAKLAIKSYLKFCRLTNNEPWDPERPDDHEQAHTDVDIKVEYVAEDDVALIETGERLDQDDFDIFSDHDQPKPKKVKKQEKKKAAKKKETKSKAKLITQELTDEVLKCCQVCHPGNQEMAANVNQSMFDKILSDHMLQVHKIEDEVFRYTKYWANIRSNLNKDIHSHENNIMKCQVTVLHAMLSIIASWKQ